MHLTTYNNKKVSLLLEDKTWLLMKEWPFPHFSAKKFLLEGTPCNVIEHCDKLYPWLCIWSHTIQLLINQIMHLHIKSLLEPDFLYNTPEVWVWSLQEQDRLSTISISLELSNKVAKTFTFTTRKLRLSKTPFLLFQKKWLFFTASRKKVWKVPYFHQLSHFVSAQQQNLFFLTLLQRFFTQVCN